MMNPAWELKESPAQPIAHSPAAYLDLFRELDFRLALLRRPPFLGGGTLAPFFRASDNPIAMACSRLFTLPPRPALPLRRVPRFRRRIALSTVLPAALPYFRRLDLREERFFVAMEPPRIRG
jgi:hypothetical protein